MFIVTGLEQIRVKWLVRSDKSSYQLLGFLLYTDSDRAMVDYMRDGIFDLDELSGEECAIFVIESPSEKWINYSKQKNHDWWTLFGKELAEKALSERSPEKPKSFLRNLFSFEQVIIKDNLNTTIVVGNDNTVSLAHIIQPTISLLYNRNEALKVARHFGIALKELPCIFFFKDFESKDGRKVPLQQYDSQSQLTSFFRSYFESDDYKSQFVA